MGRAARPILTCLGLLQFFGVFPDRDRILKQRFQGLSMSARDISFATFNLYNLQLPGKPWRWNADPYTEDLYRQKVAWSAEMVAKLDVDVIGFQELWSRQCLVDIFEKAGLQEQYQLVFIKDDWYDIAVAAAVRQPWQVRQTVIHKNFPLHLNC